jgi:phage shock protein E
MKRLKFLFLLLSVSVGTFAQTGHTTYHQRSPNKIRVDEANSKKIIKEVEQGKAYLVDVRTPEEYLEKHLKNAKNINFKSSDFAANIAQLDKSKKVYLYCRSGNRSGQATDSLINLGYKASFNIGGLDSIANKGFPLEKNKDYTF